MKHVIIFAILIFLNACSENSLEERVDSHKYEVLEEYRAGVKTLELAHFLFLYDFNEKYELLIKELISTGNKEAIYLSYIAESTGKNSYSEEVKNGFYSLCKDFIEPCIKYGSTLEKEGQYDKALDIYKNSYTRKPSKSLAAKIYEVYGIAGNKEGAEKWSKIVTIAPEVLGYSSLWELTPY